MCEVESLLIKDRSSIDECDWKSATALGLTVGLEDASDDHVRAAKTLIAHKAKFIQIDDEENTVFHNAAWGGNEKMMRLLLDAMCNGTFPSDADVIDCDPLPFRRRARGPDDWLCSRNLDSETALEIAVKRDHEMIVDMLLSYKPELLRLAGPFGTVLNSVLFDIFFLVPVRVVDVLLRRASLVDLNGPAIEIAIQRDLDWAVDWLLHQVDLASAQAGFRKAICVGNARAVRMLLDKRPELLDHPLDLIDDVVYTHRRSNVCLRQLHDRAAQMVLDRKPELIDMVNSNGNTPLHIAALKGLERFAQAVLTRKPEMITAVNCENQTVLFAAIRGGNEKIVDMLLNLKPELSSVPAKAGVSCLHIAALNCELTAYRLLALDPELIHAVDDDGSSVLQACYAQVNERLVERLWVLHPDALHIPSKTFEAPWTTTRSRKHLLGRMVETVRQCVHNPLLSQLNQDLVNIVVGYLHLLDLEQGTEKETNGC